MGEPDRRAVVRAAAEILPRELRRSTSDARSPCSHVFSSVELNDEVSALLACHGLP